MNHPSHGLRSSKLAFARLASATLIAIMATGVIDALAKLARQAHLQLAEPVLYWDSWIFVLRDPQNTLGWIISQHNEHRIAWARLATIFETEILRLPPTSTFALQTLILSIINIILLLLICFSIQRQPLKVILLWLSCSLILLNPWQASNFYWEFQVPWIFANTVVLLSTLLLLAKPESAKARRLIMALIILIPWIAIYNSGQGFALSLALVITAYFRSRKLFIAASISALLATLFYFKILLYIKPTYHPPIGFDLKFFLIELLGGRWIGMGVVMIALTVAMILGNSVVEVIKTTLNQSPALIMPGLFSIIFVFTTTLTRSGLDIKQAYASHYVSHTLMLPISLLLLLAFARNESRSPVSLSSRLLPNATISCLVLATTLLAWPQSQTWEGGSNYQKTWESGQQSYYQHLMNFRCEAAKALESDSSTRNTSTCITDQLWPSAGLRRDYYQGKLPVKPLGWHLKAGILDEADR